MNVADLKQRMSERLDQSGANPVYYTPGEMLAALNRAQRLMAMLTLCIERTKAFALTAGQTFYTISSNANFSDFLVPLKASVAGVRVRPARIHELNMLDHGWRSSAGTPTKYVQMGFDLLAVYKQPAAPATNLDITYAAMPITLLDDEDIPEVDEAYHPTLAEFGVWWLRVKEGGQEMANTAPSLQKFAVDVRKLSEYVNASSRAQQYDVVPFDLSNFDESRMLKVMVRTATVRKKQ